MTAQESFMNRKIIFALIALAFVAGAAVVMTIRTAPIVETCASQSC
jgi:hypothetical protein